jgi:hypothetical protein
MQLDKRERRYKQYIALMDEWDELNKKERELPWVEVEKPYQDGWTVYIDFRDDIKRRQDYPILQTVLDLVKVSGRTKNPKIVGSIRNLRKIDKVYALFHNRKNPRDSSMEFGDAFSYRSFSKYQSKYGSAPILGRLRTEDWKQQPSKVQTWFHKVTDLRNSHGFREWYECSLPRYWLIVKVKPAIVTHIKEIDPVIKKRMAELDAEMDKLRYKYGVRYWRYNNDWDSRSHGAHRAHQRTAVGRIIKGEVDDYEVKGAIHNYNH